MTGVQKKYLSDDHARELCFVATGKSGLGHLRRITNIASALVELAPGLSLSLFTNAPVAGISKAETSLFSAIQIVPRDEMAEALAQATAGPIIIDTAVIPDLEALPNPLCLILRETVDQKITSFQLEHGRMWDVVYVPNPAEHWLPTRDLLGAREIHSVGWIYRQPDFQPGRISTSDNQDQRQILIASGGGGTGKTASYFRDQIDRVIAAFRDRSRIPVKFVQVLGPRADESARLFQIDEVVDPGPHLPEAFATADLVISTVGYNSLLELACIEVPVLLVPIERTYDDQFLRAERWAGKLGHMHRANDIDGTISWMVDGLSHPGRRPIVDLGPSGANTCAHFLIDLANRHFEKPSAAIAVKSYDESAEISANVAAHRSNILNSAGVKTPSAQFDSEKREVSYPWIEGETARARFNKQGTLNSERHFERFIGDFRAIIHTVSRLHQADYHPLDLMDFDPWRRIISRLDDGSGKSWSISEAQLTQLCELIETARTWIHENLDPQNTEISNDRVILHGDLHLGQLVFEPKQAVPWLLDLDDLALGPFEADIANFVVHFVTSRDLYSGPLRPGFQFLAGLLGEIYWRKSGIAPAWTTICAFGAAAFIRRALKLAERNIAEPDPAAIIDVAGFLVGEI